MPTDAATYNPVVLMNLQAVLIQVLLLIIIMTSNEQRDCKCAAERIPLSHKP